MLLGMRLACGIRALYELAILPERRSAVWELARKCGVSEPFLRRILLDLRAKGYVEAQKGREGGFRLVKEPGQIKIKDLIGALEKSPVVVLGRTRRDLVSVDASCPTYPFWKDLEEKFHAEIGERTLADVIALAKEAPAPAKRARQGRAKTSRRKAPKSRRRRR